MAFDIEALRRGSKLSEVIRSRGIALTQDGDEWRCLCPFHNEKSPSFTVSDGKGFFHCFGCGAHGDVIDFVRDYDGVTFPQACEILGGSRDAPKRDASTYEALPPPIDPYAGWRALKPPPDAPVFTPGRKSVFVFNPKRLGADGKVRQIQYTPSMVFPYRNGRGELVGYVLRINLADGGKITPLLLWCQGPDGQIGWAHGKFQEPRPLYGLDRLTSHPTWQVFVVEGEKAADALQRLIDAAKVEAVAVSWQGGGNAAGVAQWSRLVGRRVVLWGDADQPGENAMIGHNDARGAWHPGIAELLTNALAERVKVIEWDRDKPKGWDAADAEGEGIALADIIAWAKPRLRVWPFAGVPEPDLGPPTDEPPPNLGDDEPVGTRDAAPPGKNRAAGLRPETQVDERQQEFPTNVVSINGSAVPEDDWQVGLIYGDAGKLKPKALQNLILFVTHHAALKGIFAYNEFTHLIYVMTRPPWEKKSVETWEPRELNDGDILRCTGFLEQLFLQPSADLALKAISVAADTASFNPVRDYLSTIEWDGVKRLQGSKTTVPWLTYYFGCARDDITIAFGKRWMISAVARAFQPGCKVDTMLILEGAQGLKKSSALETLATFPGYGNFYTGELDQIGSKDAGMQLQGILVLEMAELDNLARADVATVKSWLSRRVDRFRPPYGRTLKNFPRTVAVAGTVNPGGNGYLRDATGGRRFWPVECTAIDLDALREAVPQLWAEAVALYRDGEQWWLTEDEERAARLVQQERYWEDPWAEKIDLHIAKLFFTSTHDIMGDCLLLPTFQQTQLAERRVADHLKSRGWERVKQHDGVLGKTKWVYTRPPGE